VIFDQLFELVDMGIVIFDAELRVVKWNKWMELHSEIAAEKIVGESMFNFYPTLNNPSFLKSVKYVMRFGNFYFFSQKLHEYIFPFKAVSSLPTELKYMQQNCNMGPLFENGTVKYAYLTVYDVTEAAIYEKSLHEKNIRDGLTGIYNRRYLEDRLKEECKRHGRGTRPFSLIMIDIDFFKNINDTYGHQCGDFILKSIASAMSTSIRGTDIFARYGGEEFACLLPETDLDGAQHVAETLRNTVKDQIHDFQGTPIKITISLGAAQLENGIYTQEQVVKKADEALYEAKRTGRDKVVVSS
jgi:diguanylate cyclase (GGDEF)-like protein